MRDRDGYCEHGRYVGGCGIDYMCGYCEDGTSAADVAAARHEQDHADANALDLIWDKTCAPDALATFSAEGVAALRAYVTGRAA